MALTGSRRPVHNHLDKLRRPEGDCPLCDLDWEAQRSRLKTIDKRWRTTEPVEHHSLIPDEWPFCTEATDIYICALVPNHRGYHYDPVQRLTWRVP